MELGVELLGNIDLLWNDNFKLYDNNNSKFINRREIFNRRITDFDIFVLYDCMKENCTDYYEYLDHLKIFNNNKTVRDYYLAFEYDGFSLEHQNKEKPIIKTKVDEQSLYRYYKLNLNSSTEIRFHWKNIIYTEKKGLWQTNSNDSCGYIENYNINYYEKLFEGELTERRGKQLLMLCEITFSNDNVQYTEYFRKEISLLDLAANILSLMANIFTGARIILRFYSNSFNNFKIMEKILNKKPIKKYKIKASSEMNDIDNDKKEISLKDDFKEKFIDNNKNENETNEDEYYEENDNESDSDDKRLHKLRFFDFFLNNVYCCFKKQKKQNIINMCNQIVYKYASIDSMIKNQILLENIIKDYKWNNPELNNVENNNLFIQLKSYL